MVVSEQLVVVDKDILGGTPVFKGTRVAVKTMFDYLEESSLDDFLQGYPTVPKKLAEQVIALAAEKFIAEAAI